MKRTLFSCIPLALSAILAATVVTPASALDRSSKANHHAKHRQVHAMPLRASHHPMPRVMARQMPQMAHAKQSMGHHTVHHHAMMRQHSNMGRSHAVMGQSMHAKHHTPAHHAAMMTSMQASHRHVMTTTRRVHVAMMQPSTSKQPGSCGTFMYWKAGACLDARNKK